MDTNNQNVAEANNSDESNSRTFRYEEKEYFCHNNNEAMHNPRRKATAISRGVPAGWYIVKRSQGDGKDLKTVAIVCSIACLAQDNIRALDERTRNNY